MPFGGVGLAKEHMAVTLQRTFSNVLKPVSPGRLQWTFTSTPERRLLAAVRMADNWSITSMLETVRTLTLAVIKNWYETNVMNTEDVDALIRYVSGYPSYTDQRHPVGRGSRSAEESGLTTAARAVMLDNLEDPTVIRTLSSLLAANPLFLNSDILPVASRAFEEFCATRLATPLQNTEWTT